MVSHKYTKYKRDAMNHQCPKSDRCVMECHHKIPHLYVEKYCKAGEDNELTCPTCVPELIADIIIFEEDFKV